MVFIKQNKRQKQQGWFNKKKKKKKSLKLSGIVTVLRNWPKGSTFTISMAVYDMN